MLKDDGAALWARRVTGARYLEARRIIEGAPPLLQEALAERYCRIAGTERRVYRDAGGRMQDSYMDAFRDARSIARDMREARIHAAFDDDAIEEAAEIAAGHCRARPLEECQRFAEAHSALAPKGRHITPRSLKARYVSRDWWRRQLRRSYGRRAEELMRVLGFVRRQAAPYISDDSLARVRAARAKSAHWVQETLALCEDDGLLLELEQLVQRINANPKLRRGELMLRARGFQECAEAMGHRALMATLTAPAALHVWRAEGTPTGSRAAVRDAQAWLNRMWARARAKLKRLGIVYYGFRAAEPHHDGTPHWHLVIWCPADEVRRLELVLRQVWLKEFPDEPGARDVRVKFTEEDASRGSGVGYLAKYVAKGIDGAGAIGDKESDESGRPVAEDAERVIAWARLHGIRQFQQLGGPAVGLYRELRRVREPTDIAPLEALRAHADAGNWSALIAALGGPSTARRASCSYWVKGPPRHVDRQGRTVLRITRWGELPPDRVLGLRVLVGPRLRHLMTRERHWSLLFSPRSHSGSPLGPVALTVRGPLQPTLPPELGVELARARAGPPLPPFPPPEPEDFTPDPLKIPLSERRARARSIRWRH